MPDYRKKRRNKLFNAPAKVNKKHIKRNDSKDDIKMNSSPRKNAVNKSNMRVVTGKKLERKRKYKLIAILTCIVVLFITMFEVAIPAGISQSFSNFITALGNGGYPHELAGSQVISTESVNNYYYVLTDTGVFTFSNSGKKIFSYSHGYDNPVLKTSNGRALVFNQGGTQAIVFDLNKIRHTINTEKNIITGGISDSGVFTLATDFDKYASAVSVYSKSGKLIYEWYSADDVVNNAVLSPNGKKLAVTTLNSDSGVLKSKLNILNFKSATAEFSESFDTAVYTLTSTSRSGFTAITPNGTTFFKWFRYKKSSYNNEYNISFLRLSKGKTLAVFNRESDKTDNRIAVFSANGVLKYEFDYKGIITDIRLMGNNVYCLSDTQVLLLDSEGNILRTAGCGFGAVAISVTGNYSVDVITDNKIEKIKLEQET